MTTPFWVLDSGALVAYAHGVEAVGQVLVDAADAGVTVAVPGICLVEAYQLVDRRAFDLLAMLRRNRCVRTVMPRADVGTVDECPMIGAMAHHAGGLGAGHAAYVALMSGAGVVTSRADQIHKVLGDSWAVIEV